MNESFQHHKIYDFMALRRENAFDNFLIKVIFFTQNAEFYELSKRH